MSYVLANAITGTYPDYEIDPSKVLVSRGSLLPASVYDTDFIGGSITIMWDDNSQISNAKATDKALVVIVNPIKGEAVCDTSGTERMTSSHNLNLPADWAGDEVHIYLGFISEDGKEVTNSMYLGSVTVA